MTNEYTYIHTGRYFVSRPPVNRRSHSWMCLKPPIRTSLGVSILAVHSVNSWNALPKEVPTPSTLIFFSNDYLMECAQSWTHSFSLGSRARNEYILSMDDLNAVYVNWVYMSVSTPACNFDAKLAATCNVF